MPLAVSSSEAANQRCPLPLQIPAILLFISGAAALVYQILWIKQLSLIVGVDVYAVTIGISAFFAGLALGSFVVGRKVDHTTRPLRLYTSLEFGVAALGVLTTIALSNTAAFFAVAETHTGVLAWAIPILLVGTPAILMGGTLPVIAHALATSSNQVSNIGGKLYAANTTGAIVGALIVPFLLIPAFGVRGTAIAAAALNILAAFGALIMDRYATPSSNIKNITEKTVTEIEKPDTVLALVLYAIAGGIALGYEVIWSQSLVQFMSTRSFAFAMMLATYLAGLMIGAALYARWADRIRDPWGVFGVLITAAGMLALLGFAGLGRWLIFLQTWFEAGVLSITGSVLAGMCARFFVASFCMLFLPTLLLGAAFPVALRLTTNTKTVGSDVGRVLAFNTLGGIAGTVITGFVLVPLLGLVHALAALAFVAAMIGAIAVIRGTNVKRTLRVTVFVLGAITITSALLTPTERLANLLPGARTGTLTYYNESPGGTVAVVESMSGENSLRRLYIQGVSNSGDAMPSLRYMRLQSLLPLIIHNGEPRSALVIGFGTGITAGALLPFPTLEKRVVAELLPAVIQAAPQFHGNFDAANSPGIEIRLRDGRRELLRSDEKYDLITLEPPPPSAAGVVNLYSSDFYALTATRLQANGIVAQWLPLPTQNDEDTRSLVRSFIDVFPHATLWTTELHEMLLVGSLQPITLDAARITTRFAQPAVTKALQEVGVHSPAALLATWVTDRAGLEHYVAGAAPVTDDQPRIEYATWVRQKEITHTLPALLDLYQPIPLQNADEALQAGIVAERKQLLRFYQAGLYAYTGNREGWAGNMRQVLLEDDSNPYYNWFASSKNR